MITDYLNDANALDKLSKLSTLEKLNLVLSALDYLNTLLDSWESELDGASRTVC